jgi:hypothetical protein
VVVIDRVRLHQRDDHEPSAVRQGADLERDPAEREQAARRGGGRREQRNRHQRERARETAQRELDHAAAEQDEDQPRAERRSRGPAGEQVPAPAKRAARTPAAVGGKAPAGLHGDGRDRRSRSGARAEHPARRRSREEERGERQDQDEPGDDEAKTAHERSRPAPEAPGAVDRELGRGGTRQEVARRDRVLEVPRLDPAPPLHAQPTQERDVRGRPTEPGAADPPPLPRDGEEAGPLGHLVSLRA